MQEAEYLLTDMQITGNDENKLKETINEIKTWFPVRIEKNSDTLLGISISETETHICVHHAPFIGRILAFFNITDYKKHQRYPYYSVQIKK